MKQIFKIISTNTIDPQYTYCSKLESLLDIVAFNSYYIITLKFKLGTETEMHMLEGSIFHYFSKNVV